MVVGGRSLVLRTLLSVRNVSPRANEQLRRTRRRGVGAAVGNYVGAAFLRAPHFGGRPQNREHHAEQEEAADKPRPGVAALRGGGWRSGFHFVGSIRRELAKLNREIAGAPVIASLWLLLPSVLPMSAQPVALVRDVFFCRPMPGPPGQVTTTFAPESEMLVMEGMGVPALAVTRTFSMPRNPVWPVPGFGPPGSKRFPFSRSSACKRKTTLHLPVACGMGMQ